MRLEIKTRKKISYSNVKNEFSDQLLLIGYVIFSTVVLTAVMALMTKG